MSDSIDKVVNVGPDIVVSSPSTTRRSVTAELGKTLVKQQQELEKQIQEIDKTEGDEVPQDLKDKLTSLEQEVNSLKANTAKVFFGNKGQPTGGLDVNVSSSMSPISPVLDPTFTMPTGKLSRREKNSAKNRPKDIELAAEIGENLLLEVRRLQALLQEKEERIKQLETEKADLEHNIEYHSKQLRAKEEAEEQLKDANWNLELTQQELTRQLEEIQQQLTKARTEYTKIEKALAIATNVIEQLKDKEEKLITSLQTLRKRHEQDMANNRRHVAALNREKSDLSKTIDDLKSQLTTIVATRNVRKRTPEPGATSNDIYLNEDGQPINVDGDLASNGANATILSALQGKNLNVEVETLKALNNAKRMIDNLRANLQKEKSEKYEIRKLLADSQEQIEVLRSETDFANPSLRKARKQNNKKAKNDLSDILENDSSSRDRNVEDSQDEIEYSADEHDIISGGDEDDEEAFINKDNRPSSDMFKPRSLKPDLLSRNSRASKGSLRTSSLLSRMSNMSNRVDGGIDEDIPGNDDEEEVVENTEVEARRAEALNSLINPKVKRNSSQSLKSPRMSMISQNIAIDESEQLDGHNSKNRESIVRERISEPTERKSRGIGLIEGIEEDGTTEQKSRGIQFVEEIKDGKVIKDDDASSVDSFTSANETNSKRGSATSKDSNALASKRSSKRDNHRKSARNSIITIKNEEPVKSFRDVEVQTDVEVERSDSFSTVNTGKFTFGNRDTVYENNLQNSKNDASSTRQSILLAPGDNNVDNKRFTLDLSSGRNKQGKRISTAPANSEMESSEYNGNTTQREIKLNDQVRSLDPPPRPSTGPPPALIRKVPTPSVNFGQQAGSPQIPHLLNNHLNGLTGRKSSEDNPIHSNEIRSRGININSNEIQSRGINIQEPSNNLHHHHSPSSGSISSVSSSTSADVIGRQSDSPHQEVNAPTTIPTATDPNIIHAITQTMIGEYLHKYTRRNFGPGKRHKRFFWVHPYTKTLYWSNRDPGSYEPKDPTSKGGTSYFAYIESVRQVVDHNPSPPGLHHMSLIIKTPDRELKITAASKERHEYWYQALSYLLQRPDETNQTQSQASGRPSRMGTDPWDNQPSTNSLNSNTSPNGSLRGGNREVKKKSSFSKLKSMFRNPDAPNSPLSTEFIEGQPQLVGSSLYNGMDDEDDDDLENVRQCCDGRHDVSKLERGPQKGHHHNHNSHY
ncbi:9436_t:CDS:2 [Diversispora eburnea]|uniref:9436_t:CDS:1 n=1 Tax=Diversispora eburnea TaxID=1213867 RepID=A0A9N9AEH9_9GLOM|nr:9436_t:CDS:2 [Diversispora eburnea]